MIKIFIGADHRGFKLKEELNKLLLGEGCEVIDLGNTIYDEEDDYVDFAIDVAKRVVSESGTLGVLLCGTGEGVTMTANKIKGIRAALCWNNELSRLAREHEDANVLCLPADSLDVSQAIEAIKTFINTEFSGEERHIRRIEKIKNLEEKI